MPIHTLSPREVASKAKPGLYGDGGNLFLRVAPGGAKSWVFRYWREGKRRVISLGSCDTVSLTEARTMAHEQRRLRLDGHDPAASRAAAKTAARIAEVSGITFEECAKAYIAAHRAGWHTAKEARDWTATLQTYAHPVIGKLPVVAIDLPLILRVIEPLWTEKTSTAARIRMRLENILDWATVRGYRTGDNPARWKGNLEHLLAKRSRVAKIEHHPALSYTDIGAFMAELRARPGLPARALEFAVLTAARAGEVTGATWSEIDLKGGVWVIPSERMKTRREHRVPLSDTALAIIEAMPRNGPRLFPVDTVTVWRAVKRLLPGITLHGFRSTFRDWAGERTSFAREVVEQCLAHAAGDQTELAYRRGDALDRRRQVMDAWARFCAQPTQGGEVVASGSRQDQP
jgi:integrase